MFKVLCLTIIVGVLTLRATRADDAATESQCTEDIGYELREYVKSEVWQKLFTRHYKFTISEDGSISNRRNRLKFNTIMHNALYGCSHDRDDEVDDCPNIRPGMIKSCKKAQILRAGMFRTARCAFVESSVKHLVLSDVLLEKFPLEELDDIADLMDRPIRMFGEPVANMLSVLAHGEAGGLAELMAVNLYLNNAYGTALMDKVPPSDATTTLAGLQVSRGRARTVHDTLLTGLGAFWDTWCSDRDVVTQYRTKYRDHAFRNVSAEMDANVNDTDDLIRGLNVAAAGSLDFGPGTVTLAEYTGRLIEQHFAPYELTAELQLRRFEASFEFDPRSVYAYVHGHVFGSVYVCFYWTTVTHLRLAAQYVRRLDEDGEAGGDGGALDGTFTDAFVQYARPLSAFSVSQFEFAGVLSADAAQNVTRLLLFMTKLYRESRREHGTVAARNRVLMSVGPEIREFERLLSADMARVVSEDAGPPPDRFADLSRAEVHRLALSNYRTFARLVAAACTCADDRANFIRLKRFFFFASEAVPFDGYD